MPSSTSPVVRVYIDGTHAVAQKPNGTIIDASDIHSDVINAALAVGKRVIIDAGTYEITSPLLIPDGVIVEGAGRGLTVLKVPDNATIDAVFMNKDYSVPGTNQRIRIADLTIDGNRDNGASSMGIAFRTIRAVIERVEVINTSSTGVLIDSGFRNVIRELVTYRAGGYGIKVATYGNRIISSEIISSGLDGVYIGGNKNKVIASIIEGSAGKGLNITNGSGNVVIGNTISTGTYAAVRVAASGSVSPGENVIKGNILIATADISYPGIRIDGYYDSSSGTTYIVWGTIVEGNIFRSEYDGSFSYAVYGTEEDYTLVHGNFVDENAVSSGGFSLSGPNDVKADNVVMLASDAPPGSI